MTDSSDDRQSRQVDTTRRRFLTAGTSILSAVGAAVATWPFLRSMSPSTRALAAGAPVEVNLTKIKPGEMRRAEWRGQPVWVVHRTPEMLASLKKVQGDLRDPLSDQSVQPEYTKNEERSIKPEYLVLVGICTHLGCSPAYRPDLGAKDIGADWQGGFFCACHGSRFDMAGRVYKSVPAPKNLAVPPYRFDGKDKLIIGKSPEEAG